jgi:zona occludens toxin
MAITLVTGQPGHGKTQWAIAQAMRFAKEGRPVFAGNIRGLKYSEAGFTELESLADWEACPDGSVILWDECYSHLPQRGPGRAVPGHIEALARHRHRGFDFLLVCQQPRQIDSFVTGLVERHVHCRRRFGTSVVRLLEWDKMEREPDKSTPMLTSTFTLMPAVWALYESATVHTVKRRIPWYFYALPLTLAAVAWAAYALPSRLIDKATGEGPASGAPATQAGPFSRNATITATARQDDPIAYLRPRLEGAPWTAPAYDDVALAPPPRLACMASERQCICVTAEQGTRWLMDDSLCRLTVRYGRFDPTLRVAEGPSVSPQATLNRMTPQ